MEVVRIVPGQSSIHSKSCLVLETQIQSFMEMTDSGGGETGVSLFREVSKAAVNVTKEEGDYVIGYCTLHCLHLTLSTPISKVLDEGGQTKNGEFKDSAMQLIHGVYNLQQNHEIDEWDFIYKKLHC